jgi:hypothetical protein
MKPGSSRRPIVLHVPPAPGGATISHNPSFVPQRSGHRARHYSPTRHRVFSAWLVEEAVVCLTEPMVPSLRSVGDLPSRRLARSNREGELAGLRLTCNLVHSDHIPDSCIREVGTEVSSGIDKRFTR